MREIKFRAKESSTGKWVYGFYTQRGWIDPNTGKGNVRHIIHAGFLHDVVAETIGQFTGLRDKNGKEIYEGDKIMLEDVGMFFVKYSTDMCQFSLYNKNGFVDALKKLQTDGYCVIGNVYDKSELSNEEEHVRKD